jgi:hypothetical protein
MDGSAPADLEKKGALTDRKQVDPLLRDVIHRKCTPKRLLYMRLVAMESKLARALTRLLMSAPNNYSCGYQIAVSIDMPRCRRSHFKND